jgi:hypothetical protein
MPVNLEERVERSKDKVNAASASGLVVSGADESV